MIKIRIKALVVAAVMAAGLLGGVTTAYAEESQTDHVMDFEREISVTERGDEDDVTDVAGDTISGAGDIADENDNIGDYISSDVIIGQENTPDLNIDFSMNGGDINNTGLFTPDGNLTLVDDIDAVEGASLQYMTVQTKNGTTFYIIIDRTKDQENVYFLNPVDAADLMALMDDDTKAKFQTDTEAQAKSNNPNMDTTEKTDDTVKEDKTKDKESGANPIGTLLIFVILGGGGAAAYYFLKIKPQKAQMKNDDDDLDFQDDEEYDMEKAEPDDNGKNDDDLDEEDV